MRVPALRHLLRPSLLDPESAISCCLSALSCAGLVDRLLPGHLRWWLRAAAENCAFGQFSLQPTFSDVGFSRCNLRFLRCISPFSGYFGELFYVELGS
jgi:hypothetical protein